MNIIYYLIFLTLGVFIFTFTAIPVLVILVTALPITKNLSKLGLTNAGNKITGRYSLSVIFLTAVFAITTWVIYYYASPFIFRSYLIGCVFSFLFGIGQIGANQNNIYDYIESNRQYFLADESVIMAAVLGIPVPKESYLANQPKPTISRKMFGLLARKHHLENLKAKLAKDGKKDFSISQQQKNNE